MKQVVFSAHIKQKKSPKSTIQAAFHLKNLEGAGGGGEQIKSGISKSKKIMKMTAENNEIESEEIIQKTQHHHNQFF